MQRDVVDSLWLAKTKEDIYKIKLWRKTRAQNIPYNKGIVSIILALIFFNIISRLKTTDSGARWLCVVVAMVVVGWNWDPLRS